MNNETMFSSKNQAWATRWETFYSIQGIDGKPYNLDPCAEIKTAKCDRFITKETDMFSITNPAEYFGEKIHFFANPEYGQMQKKMVSHLVSWCKNEGVSGDILIPSRTDTDLFHSVLAPNATSIKFVQGRITFGSDEYWEWVWSQESMIDINGKDLPNKLFGKVGSMNPAPFPSMVVSFGGSKSTGFGSVRLAKNIYEV